MLNLLSLIFVSAFTTASLNTSDVDLVTNVLEFHVLSGAVFSNDLQTLQFPNTLANGSKYVTLGGEGQFVRVAVSSSGNTSTVTLSPAYGNNSMAKVVMANINCTNGVIHIIDEVLSLPKQTSTVASSAGLSTLVDYVVKTNVTTFVDTQPKLTIFAPTNR